MNIQRMSRGLLPVLVLVVGLLVSGCRRPAVEGRKSGRPGPSVVTVATATNVDWKPAVAIVGTLYPKDQVTIAAQVEGQIKGTLVDFGDRVSERQELALAAQFENFIHPISILLAVPLSLPFALVTMIVLNEPLNIYAVFGLFMLFGIVKKNGILQIDYTNTLRARGMERDPAILEANRARLRPILMTTMMLVASMIPIALGQGPGSGGRASMAKVIIGGQILCLLLSLLVTPVSYSIFDDWSRGRVFRRRRTAESDLAMPGELVGPDLPG